MDSDPLIGMVLEGRYRVHELVGEGAMATVYVAEQLSIKRRVAIKVIRRDLSLEPGVVVRFRREVEAVSRLRSPHVIEFYDFGKTSDDVPYIAMELLQGQSLGQLIAASGPMNFGDVISIVRQVCSALGEAHAAGVVHRDLSTRNVFLSDVPSPMSWFVKVLDFGLAKLTSGTDAALITGKKTLGTPSYISPEAVVAGTDVDARSDLYAVGVMAFEMLVGRLPYQARTPVDMAMEHVQAQIPSARALAPHLPEEIDSFFEIALAKDPGSRFQDAETLGRAIATALGDRRRRSH